MTNKINELIIKNDKVIKCIVNNERRTEYENKAFKKFFNGFLAEYIIFVDDRLERMEKNSELAKRKKNETN